jgi:sulfatase maturation enzyme AslB (radical SAM superfamily)
MRPKIRKEQISENLLTIINSQTGNWVGGDKDKIEYIFQQIEKNNIRDLKDSNYFEIITKSELLKRQYKKKKDKPQLFVIHVGHSCNINCVYCYAKKDNNNISPKIIAGIASFLSEIPDPIWIQFMGGEPLLYIDIIEDIIYQIKRTRKSYETNFELQTNGLLLNNKNILSFLQKHQIAFGISYDGPNELSGSRYGNKTDKYDKVLNKNISILKSLNIDFGVLTVVSVSNVYKLKDVLSWAINNKLKRISFIPLISNNNITTDIYVDEKIIILLLKIPYHNHH